MRRSACWLAILGLSVQGAVGDDTFGPGTVRPKTTGQSLQFYSGTRQQEAEAERVPTRFTRRTVAEDAKADSELRNYYRELFGESAPGEAAPTETQPRTRLKPAAVEAKPAVADAKSVSGVIHAEFQKDPAESGSTVIHPVKAEHPWAQPFPGATAPKTDADQPKPKTSLTEPISVSKEQPATSSLQNPFQATGSTSAPAAAAETARAGSMTISRGPAQQASTTSPAAQTVDSAPQTPSVTVEWVKRSDINVGQECRCDLVVKNPGKSPAQQLVIEAHFPPSVRLVKADPQPSHAQGHLGWEVAELKPGEERTIQITMIPLQRGAIATRADVRFSGTAHGSFSVAEPLLAVEVQGPKEVLLGEPAAHTVTVSNPGTGIATNVQIEAHIPPGLEHSRGERLVMDIGSLNPGESRSVRLALAATKGGRHQVSVQARADSGLARNSAAEVQVIAPRLTASIDGPGLRYLGRQGTFTLSVQNEGAAATDNVRLMHKIPDGYEFVSADRGAQFDPATRLLSWFVGRLDREQKVEMKVTLAARQTGEFKHLVRATSEHGSLSDAELTTTIEGSSSLSVEIRDLDDPVEVGTEAVYEVRIKNDGTAPARNVALACELDSDMKFVSAQGASEHVTDNGVVVFRAIPELKPGQSSLFRVHVSSDKAGHLRFRTRLSSESIERPLTTEELTKFYGE